MFGYGYHSTGGVRGKPVSRHPYPNMSVNPEACLPVNPGSQELCRARMSAGGVVSESVVSGGGSRIAPKKQNKSPKSNAE